MTNSRWPYKIRPEDIAALDERARKQPNGGWLMRCPAHDDKRASLSVTVLDNGWAAWKCFTGCAQEAVADAIMRRGVKNEWTETFREATQRRGRKLSKVTHNLIQNAAGIVVADHLRYDYDDGSKDFETVAPDGSRLQERLADLLYGLELLRLDSEPAIVVAEGEKAADALRSIGITQACGTLGASIAPSPALLENFRDRDVILWPDADDAGRKQMETWRSGLQGIAARITVIDWKEAPLKGDADDFVRGGGTLDDFVTLSDSSPTWESPKIPQSTRYLWEGVKDAVGMLEVFRSGQGSKAIKSGIEAMDRALRGGFEPGEVYLLGAPTGGGKTTLMQDFARRIARNAGPVLFVTPEMTLESMALREIVNTSDTTMETIAWWRGSRDPLAESGFSRMIDAAARIANEKLPIVIYDAPDVTMESIEDVARKIQGLKAIVIDYAQQVADSSGGRKPRYLQVGDVGTRATVLAKSLRVPVLLASQVNKIKPENGTGRAEYAFRETAMLEHKASAVVIFDRARDRDMDNDDSPEVQCFLICHKNRHGRQFRRIDLIWTPATFTVREGELQAIEAPSTETTIVAAGAPGPELPPTQGSFEDER